MPYGFNDDKSKYDLQNIIDDTLDATSTNAIQNKAVKSGLDGKQATLVSGTNIKTVNSTSLLGSGNIDTDLKMDLLWTNANPTNSFAEQTISLDLSNYDFILIKTNPVTTVTDTKYHNDIFMVDGTNQQIICNTEVTSSRRGITPTQTGVQFERGMICVAQYSWGESNDAYSIPYQIYGIK